MTTSTHLASFLLRKVCRGTTFPVPWGIAAYRPVSLSSSSSSPARLSIFRIRVRTNGAASTRMRRCSCLRVCVCFRTCYFDVRFLQRSTNDECESQAYVCVRSLVLIYLNINSRLACACIRAIWCVYNLLVRPAQPIKRKVWQHTLAPANSRQHSLSFRSIGVGFADRANWCWYVCVTSDENESLLIARFSTGRHDWRRTQTAEADAHAKPIILWHTHRLARNRAVMCASWN